MYPVLAKALSKDHCKAAVTSIFMIASDVTGNGVNIWERVVVRFGKSVLGDHTVVDFECDVGRRYVLISEIDLAEL